MLGACGWLRVSTAFPVRSEFSCFVAAFFRSIFFFFFFYIYISFVIFCFVWFLYVVAVLKYERNLIGTRVSKHGA